MRQRLIRFMLGRYGIDTLYYVMMWTLSGLILINLFLRSWILSAVCLVLAGIMLFRFMSRNIPARRRENDAFLRGWKKVKSWFILQKDRLRDIQTARYRKCPECGAIIKFPVKKGSHTAKCPRCARVFSVRIRF